MQKYLYVGGLVGVTALATLASLAWFVGVPTLGGGLAILALAGVPGIIHLQTREFVRNLRISEGRRRRSSPDTPQPLEVDLSPLVSVQREVKALSAKMEGTSTERFAEYANEMRREARMLRLIATALDAELKQAREHA